MDSDSVKFLSSYIHVMSCPANHGECGNPYCRSMKLFVRHFDECNDSPCMFNCFYYKELARHYRFCLDWTCCLCQPVREAHSLNSLFCPVKCPCPMNVSVEEPPVKRLKTMQESPQSSYSPKACQELIFSNLTQLEVVKIGDKACEQSPKCAEMSSTEQQERISILPQLNVVETGDRSCDDVSMQESPDQLGEFKVGCLEGTKDELHSEMVETPEQLGEFKSGYVKCMKDESSPEMVEAMQDKGWNSVSSGEITDGKKLEVDHMIHSVSALEFLPADMVNRHIDSLRQGFGQSNAEIEKNNENVCQLCGMERLTHLPIPIYCAQCDALIKRHAQYYSTPVDDTVTGEDSTPPGINTSLRCCVPCYNDKRSAIVTVDGSSVPKSNLVKMKNDAKKDESWVQCEKCETWQHQICALFNGKRNGLLAQYTCPRCYIQQLDNGERTQLPPYEFLGAKDLLRTKLSDHLEQRLHRKLNDDRRQRAEALGKDFSEVPGVEDLVVRVVSSIDKVVEVKKTILDIIQEDSYPKQFPYKSKVIMVFQKIDGIEVVLFGMYVQEYGSNCPEPNRRHAYLAYLDSIKYFRPDTDIKSATGEALRTFVYHEILIGYLEYCKRRGFVSCHIWACPSGKRQDYIFYHHPNTQKMPNAKKLQKWYGTMLQKAAEEHIVVGTTNIYDRYFLSSDECEVKFSAACLPYFDGDYWPNALEDIIKDVQKEKDEKERIMAVPERALKYAAHQHSMGNTSKENQIMKKIEVDTVHWDTEDGDETIRNTSVDHRPDFLDFCQSNYHQFDTIRRAKHSSMMILYILHHPEAPDFTNR
ncbi:Histone acetyltransferase HAC12 [Acorus calamus]|uniref:histone acetyltransferase n=1 Tax=Acorus calamus TaxID=4465 RepID=A0AAV9FJA1_ACOCL|nr:Histone acetyltransferase HAC12 [Acorus calamus]